ncbi:MAG: alpha/beta fold hydrolase [Deltaproteobacteria bacterium]|nr:alpha/beta fold hydrolase [Deltaproteobacteria bacterium]
MAEPMPTGVTEDRLAPFVTGAGKSAVLLAHGFTGTPHDLRDLALHLAQQGFVVANVRLAGHAQGEARLAASRWPDWWESVVDAYVALRSRSDHVIVCGFSMGGLLCLKLAVHYPVVGAAILAAPLFLRQPLLPLLPLFRPLRQFKGKTAPSVYDPGARALQPDVGRSPLSGLSSFRELMLQVDRLLPQVTCPLLLIYSRKDRVVPFANMARLEARVKSASVRTVALARSNHILTRDYERDEVRRVVTDFAVELAATAERP